MPTERSKSYFESQSKSVVAKKSLATDYSLKTNRMEPDQVYELSTEQIEYFVKNPECYDAVLVLADTNARDLSAIAEKLSQSKAQTKKSLDALIKLGLVIKKKEQYFFVKSSLRISGNQSTKDMQWELFSRHLKQTHLKFYDPSCIDPKFRVSMISPMNHEGAMHVLSELRQVVKKVDSVELDPSDDTKVYYLGFVFGPRFHE